MRFIDLFAGVGGFRLAMERVGHECVWSCEIDKWCKAVYRHRWKKVEAGDIRQVDPHDIPDFDLLCAGFPCQSFSVAGKRSGLADARGTLFHEICRVARAKRPQMLLLENVKGLLSADRRLAFRVILESLGELGYDVEWQVLNSKGFGVPQNRPRVFIVGHLGGGSGREVFPIGEGDGDDSEAPETSRGEGSRIRSGDIAPTLDSQYWKGGGRTYIAEGEPRVIRWQNKREGAVVDDIVPSLRASGGTDIRKKPMIYRHPLNYGKKSIYSPDEAHPSLRTVSRSPAILHTNKAGQVTEHLDESCALRRGASHNYQVVANAVDVDGYLRFGRRPRDKNGKPLLLPIGYRRIRCLTPRECERLQGFPDDFTKYGINEKGEKVEISDTQRYRMMGNAVTVNVVEFIARRLSA